MEEVHYSQIHLVDLRTEARTIVHIGTGIGSSESEVSLEGPHQPVRLRFSQVNPRLYGGSILVTRLSGEGIVKVDDAEAAPSATVVHGALMTVDEFTYRCELYAWGDRPALPKFRAYWATDTGPVREQNEDAIGIYQDENGHFYAVADGVGGADAGELISAYALQYMLSVFHKNKQYEMDWRPALKEALSHVNKEVRRFASMSASASGSTLTAAVIQGWDAYVLHVGDSRLYLWNAGRLRRLTTDHATFAKAPPMIRREGQPANIAPRRANEKRNALLRGIGKSETIDPDVSMVRLQPGDRLLFCTDGVYDRISDEEIEERIKTSDLQALPRELIELANERFNNDNASVVVVEVTSRVPRIDKEPIPEQDRVYRGFNRRWSLKLKATEELSTAYRLKARRERILKGVSLVLVACILGALILLRISFMQRGGLPSVLAGRVGTPTPAFINTPTRQPPATFTVPANNDRVSATPVPTVTQAPDGNSDTEPDLE